MTATIYTTDPVLIDAIHVVHGDIGKLFDEHGRLKPIADIDADTLAAVESIETEDIYEGEGKCRKLDGRTVRVTMRDKGQAIDTLLAYLESQSRNQEARP